MEIWIPAVFGLFGVALGVGLGGALELWRRALDGRAAARVLRAETLGNRAKVDLLLDEKPIRNQPESSAWQELRLQVAPFLDELELMRIAQSYDELRDFGLARPEGTQFYVLVSQDKKWVGEWLDRMQEQARWLRGIERSKPWTLVWRLLWGWRVATKDEISIEYGISEEEFEAQKARRPANSAADESDSQEARNP